MKNTVTLLIVALTASFASASVAATSAGGQVFHASRCQYGHEMPENSQLAVLAQKKAWDAATKRYQMPRSPQPKAIVCDLGLVLVVDYVAINRHAFIAQVTINANTMDVVEIYIMQ